MSTATQSVSLPRKVLSVVPAGLWVPLLALAWVFLNVLLMNLGTRDSVYAPFFCMAAGGIDGAIVGCIVITTLSEKLHAGTAGLLGGYGFQDILNNFKLTGQYARWVHAHLDPVLDAVLGNGRESLHEVIQKEMVWIGSTAAVVVLATLIVQLIRTAGNKPEPAL
ncbi:MAG TPA: hypothetical protein VJO16_01890 [Candidatus Acidoferrum sp.]|nr:hypothetical protein [Candidatus Acidoferrum sp.]